MEVHKHPHHVTHKKKWGEYLLEFLMLFLAVFLGFIAENIRESYTENHRAKEYAQSLYDDLKKDTAMLNRTVGIKNWQNRKLDSLILLLRYPDLKSHARELYYYSCFANLPNLPFKPADITIQQLRNSGSLRYFTNDEMYKTIAQYYNECSFYLERENEINQMIPPLPLVAKIFNPDQLTFMYPIAPGLDIKGAIQWPDKNQEFKLLGTYDDARSEYSLFVQRLRRRNGFMLILKLIEKDQKDLMSVLEREYKVN